MLVGLAFLSLALLLGACGQEATPFAPTQVPQKTVEEPAVTPAALIQTAEVTSPTAEPRVVRFPYEGPYCSKLTVQAYQAMNAPERMDMDNSLVQALEMNFPEFRDNADAVILSMTHEYEGGEPVGGLVLGVTVSLDRWRYNIVPSEETYPTAIGCLPLKFDADEKIRFVCLEVERGVSGRVVDDRSGQPIEDASWKSEIEGYGVFQDTRNGVSGYYTIATNALVRRLSPGIHDVQVTVEKSGYFGVTRALQVSWTVTRLHPCGDDFAVSGDTEFRLVRKEAG